MFTKLLKDIIINSALRDAYYDISKNSTGIDEVSYVEFEKNLNLNIEELLSRVSKGLYSPEPLKKIEIGKPNSKDKRPIALSSIKDKIVQKVLYDSLNPYFDKLFSDKSYAYRADKSPLRAINRATDFLNKKYLYIFKSDIDNFFETIDQDILLSLLSRDISDKSIIRLVSLFIQVGGFRDMEYSSHELGIHQGDILSPLLSNIYLNEMDKFLESKDISFVRYGDDFVILCKSKNKIYKIERELKKFIKTLKLSLNSQKTSITHISNGFDFLGVEFRGRNRAILNDRLQKSISKIIKISKSKLGFMEFIKELNGYLLALRNYYLKILTPNATQHRLLQNALIDTVSHKIYLSKKSKIITTKKEFKILLESVRFDILFDDDRAKYIELVIAKGYERYLSSKTYKEDKRKISKKRDKYVKKFANDATLHIATPALALGISKGKFVIKKYGKVQSSYPISKIERIILEGKGFSLSSNVIKRCADEAIAIDFIDRDMLPYASLVTYRASTTQSIHNQAILLHTPTHLALAREFIRGKAKNQLNYIKYLHKYHKLMDSQIDSIERIIPKIKRAKGIDELMGYEGSISANYWEGIRLSIEIPFEKRVTFGARDIVNSSLNYGYAILYGKVQYSLMMAGLSLSISYLHALDKKKPTLTYDMIEEFRSFVVDRSIISMLNKNEPIKLDSKGLLTKSSRRLISKNIKERLGSYTMHKKESRKIENIIQSQAYRLADVVNGKESKYRAFIGKY
jgi:group II intron reverse transcriptase/maturase/CRISPR-associated endonuclease Cas1